MTPWRLVILGRSLPAVAAAVGACAALAPAAPAAVPGQFVAKLHTEGLGRAPAPAEWARWVARFERTGCTPAALRRAAREIYGGREFARLGYRRDERVAALHRGVLNRDPTRGEVARLARAGRWSGALTAVLGGTALAGLSARICDPRRTGYGFDDARGLWAREPRGPGFRGTEEALQAALDRAARRGGGTVWLAQGAVVRVGAGRLREALRIPAGVTLATAGLPGPRRYLRMARLARVGDSCFLGRSCGQPVIALDGSGRRGGRGAALRSVWVDGRGGDPALHGSAAQLEGGHGSQVDRARLTGPARGGGNVVGLHGAENRLGRECSGAALRDSLVTGYTARHRLGLWADGVTVACEQAFVVRNAVVDATDVGIVLFGSAGRTQRSRVAGNLVLAAGESAFAGLAADPHGVCADACADSSPRDFRGAEIAGNVLATAPRTAFGIGVALGTRTLFGAPPDGFGVAARFNGTGGVAARVSVGIGVSGMHDARVDPRPARWALTRVNGCPRAAVGASVSDGLASFAAPPPAFADVPLVRCWQDAA